VRAATCQLACQLSGAAGLSPARRTGDASGRRRRRLSSPTPPFAAEQRRAGGGQGDAIASSPTPRARRRA